MKKVFAFVLIAVHLFNIAGVVVLHQYRVYKADQFFNAQTGKNRYNVNDLTEIKIPVNMPGIADWKSYENIAGQIKFKETSYNYVKMKVTSTALYLMCVPNYKTTRLSGQNIINAGELKTIPVPKKDHVPFGRSFMIDKADFAFVLFIFSPPFKDLINTIVPLRQFATKRTVQIPEQPPQGC